RAIDEPCPNIECVDQLTVEPLKPPGFVRVHHEVVIAMQETAIEVNYALDEAWWENPDAAIVQEVDAGRSSLDVEHRVVAEMRIAVNDAKSTEGKPPGREHRRGEAIARRKWIVFVFEKLAPGKPIKCKQPAGRQFGPNFRHADSVLGLQHVSIKRDVFRFADIVELLA